MFSKNKRALQPPEALLNRTMGAVPSIVSADMTVVGDLTSVGEVHIDGTVQGDVTVKSLVLGEGAKVQGTITAERVRVCGFVTGSIKAEDVVLVRSARVQGNILHRQMTIEAGAWLEGMCSRFESIENTEAVVEGEIMETEYEDIPSDSAPIFQIKDE